MNLIYLIWIYIINESTQMWPLVSDFFHLIFSSFINASFCFMTKQYSIVWITTHFVYSFITWWVVCTFGYYTQCCIDYSCTNCCVEICFQFSWYISKSGIDGSYCNSVFNFWGIDKQFSKAAAPFSSPTNSVWRFPLI